MKRITAIFQLKNGVEIFIEIKPLKLCSSTSHFFDNFDLTAL